MILEGDISAFLAVIGIHFPLRTFACIEQSVALRGSILLLLLGILGLSPGPLGIAQMRVQLPDVTYQQSGGTNYSAFQMPTPIQGNTPFPSTNLGAANGYSTPVYPNTGYPTAGYPASGYPATGYPATGYPATGAPTTFPNLQNWNLGNMFNTNSGQPILYLGPANQNGLQAGPSLQVPNSGYPNTGYPNGINPWAGQGSYPNNYPSSVYPNTTPNVLFPGTNPQYGSTWPYNSGGQGAFGQWWNNFWNNTSSNISYGANQVPRFYQGARFRHTWLSGGSGFSSHDDDTLQINDTDVSLVFGVPNFLNSTRMLYIIPSYSHHLWDGPAVPGSDLPSKAFSGFLDLGWDTNPLQTLGVELGVRVGVFSAFNAISSKSVRVTGKALGRLRLTPNATLKGGVFYLDRNRIKVLPAGGILWTPNPDSRLDIFFPEPKLSHYVSTIGNTDMWWYVSGYYGGGHWTIEHTDGMDDQIDINDIRVMLGLEFGRSDQIRQGFRLGFAEIGFAFDRELLYRYRPTSSLDLHNSLVIRAGLAY